MKFNELNAQQQAKALDKHRDINVDFDGWCEHVTAEHHDKLKAVGFEDIESAYSGFCSQGDGASFTADNVDIEKFLRATSRWSHYRLLHELIKGKDISCKVVRGSSRYFHSNTTSAEMDGDWQNDLSQKQQSLYDKLQVEIDAYITAAGDAYYSDLDKCYYDLISDANVKESIIANDMDFEEMDHSVTYI